MRYLVTLRNKLVHENTFNALPDRAAFLKNFQRSEEHLLRLVRERSPQRKKLRPKRRRASRCTIC